MKSYDETKVDSSNLGAVWERVALLIKRIVGDVNVAKDGPIQTQINDLKGQIEELRKEIEDLGGTTYITSEDGSYLTTEDGYNIIAE